MFVVMGMVVVQNNGFFQFFIEYGYVVGFVVVCVDLMYQQGMCKMWSCQIWYDFYFLVFVMFGEQVVLNKEIYCDGFVNDVNVFGYQECWVEYRYFFFQVMGLFCSILVGMIDLWYLVQKFVLFFIFNFMFIQDMLLFFWMLVVGVVVNGQQLIVDFFFDCVMVWLMLFYFVFGLIDYF